MKEVQIQKEMLQQDDIKTFLENQRKEILRQIQKSADKFHNYAEIIKYNEDNKKLLAEVVESIHNEAYNMVDFISDNK